MARLPRNVLLLAVASFLADVSGEMLMAVLPFLLLAQGATGVGLGLVGGLADAVGHLVKPASGWVADRTRRRKPLIVGGYLVAALSRVGIALAPLWQLTLLFRGADRLGKGVRTAPRDALLAESVPRERRGRAFGIHRAADTAGAFVGVALALAMLALWGARPSTIVLAGALVGLTTLLPLALVREGRHGAAAATATPGADGRPAFEPASPEYKKFLLVAGIFALGNVSYLFFLVRVEEAFGAAEGAVAWYLGFNLVYAAAAYPMGHLADRVGKGRVLVGGFLLFAVSAGLLLASPTIPLALAALLALGFAFASVDGVERALAADLSGSAARGTRLGVFSATVGLATVAGGLVAGMLWDHVGAWATFAWAALLPAAAALLLLLLGLARAPGPTPA